MHILSKKHRSTIPWKCVIMEIIYEEVWIFSSLIWQFEQEKEWINWLQLSKVSVKRVLYYGAKKIWKISKGHHGARVCEKNAEFNDLLRITVSNNENFTEKEKLWNIGGIVIDFHDKTLRFSSLRRRLVLWYFGLFNSLLLSPSPLFRRWKISNNRLFQSRWYR